VAAGPEEAPRAESLFRSGKDALQRGDYEVACPRLAESQRLEPAAGTLLALALCYEGWGKNATAWALFQEAEAMARAQGRNDRVAIARARVQALEAGLSFLTIEREPEVPASVEVSVDGVRFGEAGFGAQTAVNVGSHHVQARFEDAIYFTRTVELAAKTSVVITIPPPPAKPAAVTRAAPPPPTSRASASKNAPSAMIATQVIERKARSAAPRVYGTAARPTRPDGTVGHVVLGVGLASLFAGAYFGVRAWQENAEFERACPRDPCSPNLEVDHRTAQRDASLSNWFGGAGLVATVTGAYLSLRSSDAAHERADATWRIVVPLRGGAGAACSASF
jgi:hypothetical protein